MSNEKKNTKHGVKLFYIKKQEKTAVKAFLGLKSMTCCLKDNNINMNFMIAFFNLKRILYNLIELPKFRATR